MALRAHRPAPGPPSSVRLTTERLLLRLTIPADAARAVAIQSDWNVARMLLKARFPPDLNETSAWFLEHEREWRAGTAYRFAVLREERMIGVVDIDAIAEGRGELGYWLEKPSWGNGYASEAARAVVDFAFRDLGLMQLRAGHAVDNSASRNVLVKLGFEARQVTQRASRSRGTVISYQSYGLMAAAWLKRSVQ